MISLLTPTRKRPDQFRRMVESARRTATTPIEIISYVDDDDMAQAEVCRALDVKCVVGPRIVLTDCWNKCIPLAEGDIFCQNNDDVIFRTPGWSRMVEDAFAECPDKVLMVHGSDEGQHFEKFGPHPFVHKIWPETLGYFIPPFFSSDYGDAWVNVVANTIKRRKYLPFVVEHLHFLFKKANMDRTYEERLARHQADRVDDKWAETEALRVVDAQKLAEKMVDGHLLDIEVTPGMAQRTKVGQPKMLSTYRANIKAICPRCGATITIIFSNGRRCNQCGHQWAGK